MRQVVTYAFVVLGMVIVIKKSLKRGNLWPMFGYGIGALFVGLR